MVPHHINCMISVAFELLMLFNKQQSMKKILAKNIETLVEFNQHFVQGLWQGDDPLLQLPHFNETVIKNYRRLLREHSIPDAKIETFCRLSPHQRQSLKLLPA